MQERTGEVRGMRVKGAGDNPPSRTEGITRQEDEEKNISNTEEHYKMALLFEALEAEEGALTILAAYLRYPLLYEGLKTHTLGAVHLAHYALDVAPWHGKDAVLGHLEGRAKGIAGKSGAYSLSEDDTGTLYVTIAGFSFLGAGMLSIGGNEITVVNGLVTEIQKPEAN
jgi:hypothetical protein